MRLRCLLPLLVVLALPASAQAATPGIVLNSFDSASVNRALGTGAGEVRMFVSWTAFQPKSPAMDSAYLDALMSAIKQIKGAGREVLLTFNTAPSWANGGHASMDYPPTPAHEQDFASFGAAIVRHAAKQGTRVDRVTVWNEPDEAQFWKPGAPDIDRYASLLRKSYDAIKAADPGVQVFPGGTAGNDRDWIDGLFTRAKGKFDGVAVHTDNACLTEPPSSIYRDPDGKLGRFTFVGFLEVLEVLKAHGVPDMPVLMDEMGASSTGGDATSCTRGSYAGKKPSGVSELEQADILTRQYQCLANYPQIISGDWFRLDDAKHETIDEFNHYGLFRTDGSAKPALAAFLAIAATGGGIPAPCADLSPPAVRILSPAPGEKFEGQLDIRASANDAGGVGLARISLFSGDAADLIRNFTTGLGDDVPVKLTPWYGSDELPVGRHTLRVSARDKNGNVGTATVDVEKVAPGTLPATLRPRLALPRRVIARGCTRRRCTADFGTLKAPAAGGPTIQGKVAFEWQWRNKQGRWRKLVGGLKPANKRLKATVRLPKAGRWRVRIVYAGRAPYKRLTSKYVTFRVR
ncbi:MAG TPA: Ig-like domain-containing protein [Solirubrobacteraceae bacterium]